MAEVASEANNAAHVVIAIVATDEAKNIVGCLGSLNNSSYRDFSVIVCENGGLDAFDRDVKEVAKLDGMTAAPDDGGVPSGQAES